MFKKILLQISVILLPILAAYFVAIFAGLTNFYAVGASILSACGFLTLYNHLHLLSRSKTTFNQRQELVDLENLFENRIKLLEEKADMLPAVENIEERLASLEIHLSDHRNLDAQESSSSVVSVSSLDNQSFDTASNPNVIPLGSALRRKHVEERNIVSKKDEELMPKGMSIEKHFHLYLQPIFKIPEQEVSALTAIAGLYDPSEKQRHLFHHGGATLSAGTNKLIAIKSVEAACLVMSEMQANQERVPLILDITAALTGSDATWGVIESTFKNEPIFDKMFIAQISMKAYLTLSKKQLIRLSKLRELPIELCIGNCIGHGNTIKSMESGIFQNLTISAAELMRYNKKNSEQLNEVIMGLANDYQIKVVASEIERDGHIVAMLNYDVKLAQGAMLSDPILSKVQISGSDELIKDA